MCAPGDLTFKLNNKFEVRQLDRYTLIHMSLSNFQIACQITAKNHLVFAWMFSTSFTFSILTECERERQRHTTWTQREKQAPNQSHMLSSRQPSNWRPTLGYKALRLWERQWIHTEALYTSAETHTVYLLYSITQQILLDLFEMCAWLSSSSYIMWLKAVYGIFFFCHNETCVYIRLFKKRWTWLF